MSPLVLKLEFTDLHQATARILDVVRRMGFDLTRCTIKPAERDRYIMLLCLSPDSRDPARFATLTHRLTEMPAVSMVDAGTFRAATASPTQPGLSILGTEMPPA